MFEGSALLESLWSTEGASRGNPAPREFTDEDVPRVSSNNYTVSLLLASSVDLFVAKSGDYRHAVVGLFDVRPSPIIGTPTPPSAEVAA